MAKRKRNIRFELPLTETEKELIKERMEFCKISSMSSYIRTMAIDGCILVVDHNDVKRYNYLLSKISTNINQIAHHVNATETVKMEEIKQLQEMMDNIWQLQKSNQYIQL